ASTATASRQTPPARWPIKTVHVCRSVDSRLSVGIKHLQRRRIDAVAAPTPGVGGGVAFGLAAPAVVQPGGAARAGPRGVQAPARTARGKVPPGRGGHRQATRFALESDRLG